MSQKKEIKTITLPLQIKAVKVDESNDQYGIIEGYAAAFDNVDYGLDVIVKGAFTKTLMERGSKVPILADHDPYKPVGYNLMASEDNYGLLIKGQINLATQLGRERYALCKQALEVGTQMGLSIGYSTIKAEPSTDNPNIRLLKEVILWEYSIVTFPMNENAMVNAAKNSSFDKIAHIVKYITNEGISLKDIEQALVEMQAAKNNPSINRQSFKDAIENFKL